MKPPLIPPDQATHLIVGALLALLGASGAALAGLPVLTAAALICAAGAVGKETLDHRDGRRLDLRDIAATLAGGAFTTAAIVLGGLSR